LGIALGANAVYWIGDGANPYSAEGSVMKVGISGGTPVTLASNQAHPQRVAVDATAVYWTNGGLSGDGSVMKVGLSGGAPVSLASGQQRPVGLAVDANAVYWTTSETVMKVDLAGGMPSTLASAQKGPFAIAVDNEAVYWTDCSDSVICPTGTVMKVAK
jgi:hypothetical protein